ncbi:MAG: hypothetical protein HC896_02525 [Bacteroidales bacterium]|nr:hypothetical protein [Bacteroidales bacterium]
MYAAEDVPIYHNFRVPELAAFKAFYWLNSVINVEGLRGQKYSKGLISDEILELSHEIYELCTCFPTIEIWSTLTPYSLTMQIEYFWGAGFFESKEQAVAICEFAKEEFKRIQVEAEAGCKFNKYGQLKETSPYLLFHSDIEIGNNTILVEVEQQKSLYLTHNTLNKITTFNRRFVEESEEWLKVLMKKSTPLSGVSEKQRNQFFNRIHNHIQAIQDNIERDK